MLRYLKKYPLSLAFIAVILCLSFFTPPKTGMPEIPYMDKLVHTCMYAGLCLFIWIEYLRSHRTMNHPRMFIGSVILPFIFSGSIEWLQSTCTNNRSGEWADLAANFLGIFLAALFGKYVLYPYFRKKK